MGGESATRLVSFQFISLLTYSRLLSAENQIRMMLGHDRALICFTSQNTQNSTTQLMKKERKKMKQASDGKQVNQQ